MAKLHRSRCGKDGLVSGSPEPGFFVVFRALCARYAVQPADLLSVLNLAFLLSDPPHASLNAGM